MTESISVRQADRWPRITTWTLTPARITGIYIAFGVSALYVSDVLLPYLVTAQPFLEQLQFAKGFVEVGVTGVLIYSLTAQSWGSLHETNEHLDAARRQLGVLHRIFRHNLRNDVTVVAGHAETIEDEVERPQLEDHCDAIRSSCEDLITYTEKAKLVADLNRRDVETQSVDLAATLQRVEKRIDPLPSNVSVDVSVSDDAEVVAHEYIEFAITELVENALVHHDGDSPATSVTVEDAPDCAGWTQLRVEDDGPGIPGEELDAIESGEQPLHHGSGVGLWVASWIVVQSGGDFEIENTATGCRATIRLPTPETTPTPKAETALRRFLA